MIKKIKCLLGFHNYCVMYLICAYGRQIKKPKGIYERGALKCINCQKQQPVKNPTWRKMEEEEINKFLSKEFIAGESIGGEK